MHLKSLSAIVLIGLMVSCGSGLNKNSTKMKLDVQGHRGCRGLMPENTVEGFLHALELGVTTLEFDVVISKDNKVVVSHEPWFSHLFSTQPNGEPVSEKEERGFNIYEMEYSTVQSFDVGQRVNPKFPDQKSQAAIKPLLRTVFERVEAQNCEIKPIYNIEIKYEPKDAEVYYPSISKFVELVLTEIKNANLKDRCFIQSFDFDVLKEVKRQDDGQKITALIWKAPDYEDNMELIGFTPEVYSPNHQLVNGELVEFCQDQNMKLIPYTVNERSEMKKLIELGVDGIITDYPDVLIGLCEEMGVEVGVD